MTLYVAPIVEGQTEQKCLERLLQRVWTELLVAPIRLQVLDASRGQRDALLKSDGVELARKVGEAHTKLAQRLRRDPVGSGAVFLILDAEADCPAILGPALLAATRSARSDADIACVLAKRMLENWIVAGCSTLAGVNGLPNPVTPPADPEDGSGVVWLGRQLRSVNKNRKYKKTVDAEAFVSAMNLEDCRKNSPSFDKLCRELEARVPPPPPDPPDASPPSE